jgi:hypothetical protein
VRDQLAGAVTMSCGLSPFGPIEPQRGILRLATGDE